jgi:hypothetical protein
VTGAMTLAYKIGFYRGDLDTRRAFASNAGSMTQKGYEIAYRRWSEGKPLPPPDVAMERAARAAAELWLATKTPTIEGLIPRATLSTMTIR